MLSLHVIRLICPQFWNCQAFLCPFTSLNGSDSIVLHRPYHPLYGAGLASDLRVPTESTVLKGQTVSSCETAHHTVSVFSTERGKNGKKRYSSGNRMSQTRNPENRNPDRPAGLQERPVCTKVGQKPEA
ncbi:hypothetical protein mRhiFer1_009471 [Rhinolophus ferrumequinum]|uniref:Uncharacterized protein n=1 Tax=Rhinolophus ferrumequinum TaxID=59479 RepID=A0A7J7RF35_RHIFE|nr:hypothetical protein mRhiFer1_009471 [Rhinolophus ferrumequinum]